MKMMVGDTWEVAGGKWEKFEVLLEQEDLVELCDELGLNLDACTVNQRYLLLRQKGRQIEAIEKLARKYIDEDTFKNTMLDTQHNLAELKKRIVDAASQRMLASSSTS